MPWSLARTDFVSQGRFGFDHHFSRSLPAVDEGLRAGQEGNSHSGRFEARRRRAGRVQGAAAGAFPKRVAAFPSPGVPHRLGQCRALVAGWLFIKSGLDFEVPGPAQGSGARSSASFRTSRAGPDLAASPPRAHRASTKREGSGGDCTLSSFLIFIHFVSFSSPLSFIQPPSLSRLGLLTRHSSTPPKPLAPLAPRPTAS